jgi:hypothetical protein
MHDLACVKTPNLLQISLILLKQAEADFYYYPDTPFSQFPGS